MNKGVQKIIFLTAELLILLTSISPKLAGILITISNTVIGGATLVVFGMMAIALTLQGIFKFFDNKKLKKHIFNENI